MGEKATSADELVLTQAQQAPATVNAGEGGEPAPPGGEALDPRLLEEICVFADRVGGLERLKQVVDVLVHLRC